jgi:CHAT domain-containing protein
VFWPILEEVARRVDGPPTVLLLSDEPYIPWELTTLPGVDEPGSPWSTEIAPVLGAQAAMGRWLLTNAEQPPAHRIEIATIAAVAGDYSADPRWETLQAALDERSDLARLWGAVSVDATYGAVVSLLEGEPHRDAVHMAIHGKYSDRSIDDGLILTDRETMTPNVVLATKLKGHPFVFLNACQVGSGREVLGDYAGMAAAFLVQGAAGVIAPLWSVNDEIAREIALKFYQNVFAGTTTGEAIRAERAKFTEHAFRSEDESDRGSSAATTSSTLMAYQFFGHPALKIGRNE